MPPAETIEGINIDVAKFKNNSECKAMLGEGYPWRVVPYQSDAEFPSFARIAQRALNANNHVAQDTSEIEGAIQMVEACNDHGFKEEPHWKQTDVADSIK